MKYFRHLILLMLMSITTVFISSCASVPEKIVTIQNKKGMKAKITNYGGTVMDLHVPDKNGKMGDVVLGFEKLSQYKKESPILPFLSGTCKSITVPP